MGRALSRLNEKRESEICRGELENYLLEEIRNCRHFFKSRDIAKATGYAPSCVGTNFAFMQRYSDVLDIVRWSKSGSSSVWRITVKAVETGVGKESTAISSAK